MSIVTLANQIIFRSYEYIEPLYDYLPCQLLLKTYLISIAMIIRYTVYKVSKDSKLYINCNITQKSITINNDNKMY